MQVATARLSTAARPLRRLHVLAEKRATKAHLHQQVQLAGGVARRRLARLNVLLQAIAQVLQGPSRAHREARQCTASGSRTRTKGRLQVHTPQHSCCHENCACGEHERQTAAGAHHGAGHMLQSPSSTVCSNIQASSRPAYRVAAHFAQLHGQIAQVGHVLGTGPRQQLHVGWIVGGLRGQQVGHVLGTGPRQQLWSAEGRRRG